MISLFALLAGLMMLATMWSRHLAYRRLQAVLGALELIRQRVRPPSFNSQGDRKLQEAGLHLDALFSEISSLQRTVQEKDRMLQSVLGTMSDGIMAVDGRHVIQRINPEFMVLFHLQKDPVGQTVLEALREAEIEVVIRDTLRRRNPQTLELSVRDAQSPEGFRQFQMRAQPLLDQSGAVLGVLATFHDVSPLRKIERARREFVANVSHELRTPLAVISGYVEMLIATPTMHKPERLRAYATMQRNARRLQLLLEDLLQLSRMESRRFTLRPEEFELEPFCHRLLEDWLAKSLEKKVRLELEVDGHPGKIEADPSRLEQAVSNLLENAIKYSHENSRIVLSARRENETWSVAVTDFGVGIPPQDLPHIFEPFYRVDKARTRDLGGTGLGLSIVRQIVESHGGTVRANSEMGVGTTIVLTFPLEPVVEIPVIQETATA
jgi:two-component system phosphate regulon sensor histidine kinase PhoR